MSETNILKGYLNERADHAKLSNPGGVCFL